ncbi:MAG TPA: rod-binding protein [Sphingomonas sp.]|nr:rod-binding protein [Sphingomonas sp.]
MIQAVSPSPLAATPDTQATAQQTKLKSAAQAFEAVFLRQMIGAMRQSGPGDGMLDNEASNQFRDMADSKMADSMAQKGVLGIAEMLLKQVGPIAAKAAGGTGSTGGQS